MRIDEVVGQKVTLMDVYGGEYPHESELIWEYISPMDMEDELFTIQKEDIENLNYKRLIDAYKKAAPEQQELVEYYRNEGLEEAKNSIIVVAQDEIIDGHHRIVALVKEGIKYVNTIDITE